MGKMYILKSQLEGGEVSACPKRVQLQQAHCEYSKKGVIKFTYAYAYGTANRAFKAV
jgi:hypothetical protein